MPCRDHKKGHRDVRWPFLRSQGDYIYRGPAGPPDGGYQFGAAHFLAAARGFPNHSSYLRELTLNF